jgi:hypothetical protein
MMTSTAKYSANHVAQFASVLILGLQTAGFALDSISGGFYFG